MSRIPPHVDDDETLVRCVCTPYHVNKAQTSLSWKAFYPTNNSNLVSVIRSDYTGADFCKVKGKALANPKHRKFYVGLGVIAAASIRVCEADVQDDSRDFEGHAHLVHEFTVRPHEPNAPDVNATLKGRCTALLRYAKFLRDPNPDEDSWNGSELKAELPVR